MQRLLNRRGVLDVFRLGLSRAARGTTEDPGRPHAREEQSFERTVALDQRAIHLGGSRQQHHVHENTRTPLLCATGKWTGKSVSPVEQLALEAVSKICRPPITAPRASARASHATGASRRRRARARVGESEGRSPSVKVRIVARRRWPEPRRSRSSSSLAAICFS